jgi:hypothetical protein
LLPAAAISGRVVDGNGDPIAGVLVQASRLLWYDGRSQLVPGRVFRTDDRGAFRVFGLKPGRYYVFASDVAEMAETGGNPMGFVPTFYPNTASPGPSAAVTVQAGDDLTGYDITLVSEPTVVIRGRIPVGNGSVSGFLQWQSIQLYRVEGSTGPQIFETTRPDLQGNFVLAGVAPGTYLLYWRPFGPSVRGSEEADLTIQVGESDVDGINLIPQPEMQIEGKVSVEGSASASLSGIEVKLIPTSPLLYDMCSAKTRRDDSFTVGCFEDGVYNIQARDLPPDFYLKSAEMGGEDVLSSGVTLSHSEGSSALEIVLSPNAGHIAGVVLNNGKPVAANVVTLIATQPLDGVKFWYEKAVTDGNGRFAFEGLAPGEYKLRAWQRLPDDFGDPALFPSIVSNGVDVNVSERSRLQVTLQLTGGDAGGD